MRGLIIDLILFVFYVAWTVLSAIKLHMNHSTIALASIVIISVIDGLCLGNVLNDIKEILSIKDKGE